MSFPKKICLIIHSLGIGGMERVMSHLANNFADRENVEVHLILIGKKREIKYPLTDSINIHRPSFQFRDNRRKTDTIRTMRFLRGKVQSFAPDTILCFGEIWNNLVLLSLVGLGYPIYVADRSEPEKDLGKLQNLLRNWLYPGAAGYIAQTEEAKKICIKRGWNDNVEVIGNPIRKIHTNGTVEKENIVLTVGRLIKTKHIDQLIKMFAEINKAGWKLFIVGGDAKRMQLSKELSSLISDLEVEDLIFLEGEQQDIDRYYNMSKIFAFTSSSEGFPNVIGEALSAGLPVVSYDCVAGPSEMIEDGINGFLVKLFDEGTFKEKLELLMEDEQLREKMGNNASNSILERDPDLISSKFYSFITEMR